ncbi:hypothetical protein B0J14DRAFT_340073 [Halenospora varia]|nr:hypothetical protein B0J14DRAFT_340073 [Halenospora varia]
MKTLTYTRTLHPTFTLSNYHTVTVENPNSKAAAESTPSYDATVTLTTIVTVPYSKPTPSAEGSEDPISYYVTGTKTVYLNGHPPDSTESIVYLTNPVTVTVSPINEASSTVADPGQSAAGSGAFPHTVTELGTQTIKVIGDPPSPSTCPSLMQRPQQALEEALLALVLADGIEPPCQALLLVLELLILALALQPCLHKTASIHLDLLVPQRLS